MPGGAHAIHAKPTGAPDGGEIAGACTLSVGSSAVDQSFIDTGGNARSHEFPGAMQAAISGINNRAQVAGWFEDAAERNVSLAP